MPNEIAPANLSLLPVYLHFFVLSDKVIGIFAVYTEGHSKLLIHFLSNHNDVNLNSKASTNLLSSIPEGVPCPKCREHTFPIYQKDFPFSLLYDPTNFLTS